MHRFLLPVLLLLVVGLVPAAARADDDPEPLDLSQVEHIEGFPGDEAAKAHLAREGFVVLPRFHRQMFSLYIGGSVPYYITCDSAHRTYQVLFESALQGLDGALAARMRRSLLRLHERLEDGHPLARAYVAVALRLFGEAAVVPEELSTAVAVETALVQAASVSSASPLFGVAEDYAVYRPRGYYAGKPDLEAWFRVATWLGRRGFRVVDERETDAALSLVAAIESDEEAQEDLAEYGRLLDWLLGPPDDLTADEYAAAIRETTGGALDGAAIARHRAEIQQALAVLRNPEINDQLLLPDAWLEYQKTMKGLRLLPARRTPDAVLFQLLNQGVQGRSLPTGLEVALALGSRRANTHLQAGGSLGKRAARFVRSDIAGFSDRLADTHYGATLRAAALLLDGESPLLGGGETVRGAEGMPVLPAPCFSSDAWHDRLLASSLASWASLRHAWVLHAKRTVHYLGATNEPPGVVEPEPRYFAALAELARTLGQRLDAFGAYEPPDARAIFRRILPVVDAVGRGESPSPADVEMLRALAGELAEVLEVQGEEPETRSLFTRVARALRAHLAGEKLSSDDEQLIAYLLRDLDGSETKGNLEAFAKLMDDLEDIAKRELRGEALTGADEHLILEYGKRCAQLNFWRGNSWLSPDRQMGLVVDVASDPQRGTLLEAAVGAPMELYVALPLPSGKHRLHRGGVYSYYEFPATTPLTDDVWRRRVRNRQVPPLPPWTASYVAAVDVATLVKRIGAGEVAREVEHVHDERLGAALLSALETGEQSSEAEDERLAWLAWQVSRYADTPLRARILDAYVHWLLHAKGGQNLVTELPGAVERRLGYLLGTEDHARLLAIALSPPAGAQPEARKRAVRALLWAPDAAPAEGIDALFASEEPAARRAGVDLLARLFLRRRKGEAGAVVTCLLAHLEREKDADLERLVLGYLENENLIGHVPREAAPAIAAYLESEDRRTQWSALHILGAIPATDQAERLLGLLETEPDQRLLPDLARAVGRTLAPEGRDPALRARAIAALKVFHGPVRGEQGYYDPNVVEASIDGLSYLGGPEAVAELAAIAEGERWREHFRAHAVERLGEHGEAALPHLFPLVFDETEVEETLHERPRQIRDAAAVAIDQILGGTFGVSARWSWEIVDDATLEKLEKEARRRGYGP